MAKILCRLEHIRSKVHEIDRFNLVPAFVDGCAVGVVDVKGVNKIKKPWCFVCSDPTLVEKLDVLRCNKQHTHVPCAGKNTS